MNSDRQKSASNQRAGPATDEVGHKFFPGFATVAAALQAAGIGIWSWEIATGKVTWSDNLEPLHGLPRGTFDGTFSGFEQEIHPDDQVAVEQSLKQAVETAGDYHVRYRLRPVTGAEDRWVETSGRVEVKNGTPVRMFGICCDITERVKLEAELRSRIKQQEVLARLAERALAEPDLDRLLNDAVSTIAMTLGVDFVTVLELLPGGSELVLRAGFGWNGGLVGSVLASTERNSYERYTLDSPLPVVTEDFAAERRFAVSDYLRDHRCVSSANLNIAGQDGRSYGILGVCTRTLRRFSAEETALLVAIANMLAGAIQRRQLEQRHEMMIRDMRHRSGNLFSQLLALFSQTAKNSKSIADLSGKYQARVLALASAHRLLTEAGWTSLPIMELLYAVLGPYLDRVTFNGPNIEIEPDPVFNLSAALHELADNAVKHGSLSRPKGSLSLVWSVSRTDRGMTLILDWIEQSGPPARRPSRVGFGSRLISLVIERQLNGEVTRSFTRKGLNVHLVVPLTHERWPASGVATAASRPVQPQQAAPG